jgi:hypothetical protein
MCSSQREERRITPGPEGAHIITDVRPLSAQGLNRSRGNWRSDLALVGS